MIAEIVMEPRAIDVATVTTDCSPKTDASKGKPTAAELGKLTVSASYRAIRSVAAFRRNEPKRSSTVQNGIYNEQHRTARPAHAMPRAEFARWPGRANKGRQSSSRR